VLLKESSARGRAKVGKAMRRSIQFVEHLTGDGPTVFEHVCRMGLEGIVSKRMDAPYRSGPSMVWLKSKNPASEAGSGASPAPRPFMLSPAICSSLETVAFTKRTTGRWRAEPR
jgi:hypothetical protein